MRRAHTQSGQAALEGLLVLGILASLWVGAAWLGRIQDAALQAGHASRYRAFALAHQGLVDHVADSGPARIPNRGGANRQGEAFLDAAAAHVASVPTVRTPSIQIGDPHPGAAAARQDLVLGDSRVWVAGIHVETSGEHQPGLGLAAFDRYRLGLDRHTAIMRGTGASEGDLATQQRIAQAQSIWGQYADRSIALGQQVTERMQAVDAAWGRPEVLFDWLQPWVGRIPARHLYRGAP